MGIFGLPPVAGGLQAPVRDGGAVPAGRAVAATSVRNPTAIPGKAAFDKLKAMPHGESRGILPYTEAKNTFLGVFRFSLTLLQSNSLGFIFHRR